MSQKILVDSFTIFTLSSPSSSMRCHFTSRQEAFEYLLESATGEGLELVDLDDGSAGSFRIGRKSWNIRPAVVHNYK